MMERKGGSDAATASDSAATATTSAATIKATATKTTGPRFHRGANPPSVHAATAFSAAASASKPASLSEQTAKSHSKSEHEPTQEEDDKLFRSSGFRYSYAFSRGFPYPWCAKKSKKGWVVRDTPPLSSRRLDNGVEFAGWRAADKMFRSKEILMQRIQNQNKGRRETKTANVPSRSEESKPLKKRIVAPPNDGIQQSPNVNMNGQAAVDHWYRQTARAVRSQKKESKDEEFQSFLKKRRIEVKQEWRKKRKEQKKRARELQEKSNSQAPSTTEINQPLNQNLLEPPPSPMRRKHKNIIPKRNQQQANSVVLGEDPELDEMIEDIVQEFTHEFAKEETNTNGNAGTSRVVEFDGSAVSALREAAKDIVLKAQGKAKHQSTIHGESSTILDNAETIRLTSSNASPSKPSGFVGNENSTQQQNNDENVADERITDMIKQLIGEAAHDSGCQFDGRAVAALKEAAKEIVDDEGDNKAKCGGTDEFIL